MSSSPTIGSSSISAGDEQIAAGQYSVGPVPDDVVYQTGGVTDSVNTEMNPTVANMLGLSTAAPRTEPVVVLTNPLP